MITEPTIIMTGVFAPLVEEFLTLKRAQGFKYYSEAKILRRFCEFSNEYQLETPVLTEQIVLDWIAPRKNEMPKSRMHRVSCINQFSKFLKQKGYTAYTPPSQCNWNKSTFVPYIFTHDEINAIFQACDNIKAVSQAKHMHKSLPVLFRLLYSCGLRISEAVNLQCKDVDLSEGILLLRNTKNEQDRLVPMSQTLLQHFKYYRENVIPWATEDDFFFMAPDRSILSPMTVYGRFRRILKVAGISYLGKGNGPRLHDLRHTFAVHTLQNWVKQGEDLTSMLPILSAYMGHKSFNATSRYLRLTAEVYPEVVKQVENICSFAIPEVNINETY